MRYICGKNVLIIIIYLRLFIMVFLFKSCLKYVYSIFIYTPKSSSNINGERKIMRIYILGFVYRIQSVFIQNLCKCYRLLIAFDIFIENRQIYDMKMKYTTFNKFKKV